ncbi:class I SAM-dependent methyltransferase [Roseivirga sp. BDSF3-8]|uniref:class I SAM-dependent methyltransferase n=1 Tax=Roseivirga sp. BDSF3-8 TaxID=3241598 RepID=UPI0035323B50
MNFDSTASWYDWLVSIVYGSRVTAAQQHLISGLWPGASVLVVGGGTGRFLPELIARKPSAITYLEASASMLAKAKRNTTATGLIEWVHGDEEWLGKGIQYDAILTFHLFSNYPPSDATLIWARLNALLKPTGYWLYTDFIASVQQNLWQRLYTGVMFWLFRLVAGVQGSKITGMRRVFTTNGYWERNSKFFYKGFIEAITYQKASD